MASGSVDRLALRAASFAEDLSYVAMADFSTLLEDTEGLAHRVIGGQMVMILAARWNLGADLYRATMDADLGVPPFVVKDHQIVERLLEAGYKQVAGDRFARVVTQPSNIEGAPREATIDILVPAYTSRARANKRVGDSLVATEVLGLASALKRTPVTMEMVMERLDGTTLAATLDFADEPSALVLKAYATKARYRPTDHSDVWRCLEIASAAGVKPEEFTEEEMARGAAIARSNFAEKDGIGMSAIEDDLHLSAAAKIQIYTRIRALADRVLGVG